MMKAAVYTTAQGGQPARKIADLGEVIDVPIIYEKRVRVDNGGEWTLRHLGAGSMLLAVAVYDEGRLRIFNGYGDSVAFRRAAD